MGTLLFFICIGLLISLVLLSIFLLFKKSGHKQADRFLALLIFSDAGAHILFVFLLLYQTHIYQIYGCVESICLIIGPSLFYYVYLSLGYRIASKIKVLINFLPAIVYLAVPVWFNLISGASRQYYIARQIFPFSSLFSSTAIRLHTTIYLIAAIVLTIKNKINRKDYFSEIEKVKFNWVFVFLLSLLVHWLLTIPLAQLNEFKYSLIIVLIPCVILNVVSFKAITDPSVFESIEPEKKGADSKSSAKIFEVNQQTIDFIGIYMNEHKPYLRKDITIQQLAAEIGLLRQELSALIKNHYNKNFFEFINSFRIEEAKIRLSQSNAAMIKIDAIADETGFNSRASFYEVFKKYTGTTPANYRGKVVEPV